MSKSVCFYFQVHQPYRLRTYRFFEIGKKHYYYDDYSNRMVMRRVAEKCYLPMNDLLMRQIEKFGDKFKVAFSFSGIAIEQMEQYAPDVLESFQKLVATGKVEVKKLLSVMPIGVYLTAIEIMDLLGLKSKETFRKNYLNPVIEEGYVVLEYPDKPTSKNQRYKRIK